MIPENVHLNIGSLLFEDLDQIDLTGPFEVLSRLPNSNHRIYAKTMDPVRDVMGLRVMPDATIAEAPQLDILHVPGGPGQQALMEDERVYGQVLVHLPVKCLKINRQAARLILRQTRTSVCGPVADPFRPSYRSGLSAPRCFAFAVCGGKKSPLDRTSQAMHEAFADRASLCGEFGFDLKLKLRPSLRLDRRGQAEHDRHFLVSQLQRHLSVLIGAKRGPLCVRPGHRRNDSGLIQAAKNPSSAATGQGRRAKLYDAPDRPRFLTNDPHRDMGPLPKRSRSAASGTRTRPTSAASAWSWVQSDGRDIVVVMIVVVRVMEGVMAGVGLGYIVADAIVAPPY
jgi:hypothetical protein